MNRTFSFLAGSLCGALVGGISALFLAPSSGDKLRSDANTRWDAAVTEAKLAKEMKQRELEADFQRLKRGRS